MLKFETLTEHIKRLRVPFDDNFTSVFLIGTAGGFALVDCAATAADVCDCILPALAEEGVSPSDIRTVFCTHLHGDHAGGLRTWMPYCENAVIVACSDRVVAKYPDWTTHVAHDGEELLPSLTVWHLPGHSSGSAGVFDARTGTLLSGDSIQQYGVGLYGCGVGLPSSYMKSLLRLRALPINYLVTSHPYVPDGTEAKGREAVARYIDEAIRDFENILAFVKENADSIQDSAAIAAAFTEHYRASVDGLPPLQTFTVKAILAEGR